MKATKRFIMKEKLFALLFLLTCTLFVHAQLNTNISLDFLNNTLPNTHIYSKNVLLKAPFRVMQNFAIDSEENIYYSQIGTLSQRKQGKTKSHELYILRTRANANSQDDFMTLKYFGHGSNIAIEETNGDTYIWVSSCGSKNLSSLEYGDSRAVSRIKYEAGKVYEEGYAGETYFLNNGIYNVHPALDIKNDILAISATESGKRYFYFYRLSEAKKLPKQNFTFEVVAGGEEIGTTQESVTKNVVGYDLSKLTPLSSFSIPKGTNKQTDINSYSFQGFDVSGKYLFFYEGDGNGNDPKNGNSSAYITVYSLTGKILHGRTNVNAINNLSHLIDAGITKTGYMEAEGIKVVGDKLYIAFASRGLVESSDDYRRANIFLYNLQKTNTKNSTPKATNKSLKIKQK